MRNSEFPVAAIPPRTDMPSVTIAERAVALGAELVIGIWCADDPNYDPPHDLHERIPASRPTAEFLGRPLIVYFDRPNGVDPAIVPLLDPQDHVALQCYRNQGESNDAFRMRVLQNVANCPVKTIWLVVGAHTRQFLSDQELIDGIRICAETIRDDADILGGMPFREGTSDGPAAHPAVADALDTVFLGITGRPALPVWVPPDPPIEPPIEPPIGPPITPPIPPPIQETDPMVSISVQNIMPGDAVNEVPHPDGGGLVGLESMNGNYLTVEPNGQWRWTPVAMGLGAWEAFYPGVHYTAQRDGATWILPKGGAW